MDGTVKEIPHFVQGAARAGASGRAQNVFNPAFGTVTADRVLANKVEVDAACKPRTPLPGWSATPPHMRAQILFKLRELLEADTARLAAIITAEHGKVLSDAKGELARGMEVVEFACGIPQL